MRRCKQPRAARGTPELGAGPHASHRKECDESAPVGEAGRTAAPRRRDAAAAELAGESQWSAGRPAPPATRDLQVYRMALNLQNEELERLRAEVRTLRESEASHRVLFESSPDAIFRSSPEGTIYAANPAACAMVGRTEAEIQRIGRDGIIDRNDPRWLELVEQRQRAGTARAETELIRADGSAIPVEVAAALFTDGGGKVCSNLFVRDITGRKRMEQALRASETRYRDLVENGEPDHPRLRSRRALAAHQLAGGVPDPRLPRGRSDRPPLPRDHPARLAGPTSARFYREQSTTGSRAATSSSRCWRRTAPTLDRQSVKLVAEGDRILRFEAIAHDLTGHQAAEEALRKSVAQTQQLVAHLSTVREEESAKIAAEAARRARRHADGAAARPGLGDRPGRGRRRAARAARVADERDRWRRR